MDTLRRNVASAAASLLLAGCASVHVDEQGRTHIVGLVWLTLPAPAEAATASPAAHVVRTRSVGLTLQRSPDGGALALGYSDALLATIYNDSIVRLPPAALADAKGP